MRTKKDINVCLYWSRSFGRRAFIQVFTLIKNHKNIKTLKSLLWCSWIFVFSIAHQVLINIKDFFYDWMNSSSAVIFFKLWLERLQSSSISKRRYANYFKQVIVRFFHLSSVSCSSSSKKKLKSFRKRSLLRKKTITNSKWITEFTTVCTSDRLDVTRYTIWKYIYEYSSKIELVNYISFLNSIISRSFRKLRSDTKIKRDQISNLRFDNQSS